MEGELFADGVLERAPAVLDGVEVRGVGRQEFARTPCAFDGLLGLRRLVEGGVVVEYDLPGLEDGDQTVRDIGLAKSGIAVAFKDEGGNERVLVKGVNDTDPLGAVTRLLPPAGFTPRTPALG